MNITDNVVAYRPQLLPSIEVAKHCTYKHTSPVDGTYYGRTYGFEFTVEELDFNRWNGGEGYTYNKNTPFANAIRKYGWENFKHEVCKTHLFDWECGFVEYYGVLESMSTGHSYNLVIPHLGDTVSHHVSECTKERIRISNSGKKHNISDEGSQRIPKFVLNVFPNLHVISSFTQKQIEDGNV